MEMAFEVTHLQPRSSSVPISGQSGDPDYPQMSPDDEDFSDDDSTREDDAILPGDIDDYVYDNHDGTSTCIWPDASNEAGYCGRVSTWPLIKRHIKRMHYHERSVVLFVLNGGAEASFLGPSLANMGTANIHSLPSSVVMFTTIHSAYTK